MYAKHQRLSGLGIVCKNKEKQLNQGDGGPEIVP